MFELRGKLRSPHIIAHLSAFKVSKGSFSLLFCLSYYVLGNQLICPEDFSIVWMLLSTLLQNSLILSFLLSCKLIAGDAES